MKLLKFYEIIKLFVFPGCQTWDNKSWIVIGCFWKSGYFFINLRLS